MAPRSTLNAENLEALGAARLAAMLMELGTGDVAVRRRLRLELAAAANPAALVKEIRKRLGVIARSRPPVDSLHRKLLLNDLESQRRAIMEQVATQMPSEALDLMWQFLKLSGPVLEHADDSGGAVIGVFHAAVVDLGAIALAAREDPESLAEQAFFRLTDNRNGEYDYLIAALQPALGPAGLEHLKQLMIGLSQRPVAPPAAKDRQAVAWGSAGPIYADELAERSRVSATRLALQAIADAQGDVDLYIAQYDAAARESPMVAAHIAQRLLRAGRAEEAWQAIEAARRGRNLTLEWDDARIAVLEALGRADDAQAARWSCFEQALSARHLREYLKQLPDFEDFEAEQRALDQAEQHRDLLEAIAFLVQWPALDRAARIVLQRAAELDGNIYEYLTPAAEALRGRYPLAATVLLRAMIGFTLQHARTSRYGHAARHLRDCAGLAAAIADWGSFEPHAAYLARLRREHGRKNSFWNPGG